MDVLDQLEAVREGKLSRRDFSRSLMAVGIGLVAMPVLPRRASAAPEEQATYFTWGGFDVPELFKPYVEKHGELPNFATFGGTEEALTKMRAGFIIDVSHPCNADILRWEATGLFQPIDLSRLANGADLIPELYDYDYNMRGGNPLMLPYEWGQTAITYRTDLFELDGEESWNMLWDKRYSGKLGSLGSGGDTWWCGAIKAGIPFDKMDSDDAFARIGGALREQRPLIRLYTDDTTTLDQALASGELVASMTWNSSAVALKKQEIPVKFAQPKEGSLTWVCGMMLHKQAPKLDLAYDVLDSLISVPSGEYTMREFGYGHANRKAFNAFSDEDLAALTLSRDPKVILAAGKFMLPQSDTWTTRMNTEFEEIKAGF